MTGSHSTCLSLRITDHDDFTMASEFSKRDPIGRQSGTVSGPRVPHPRREHAAIETSAELQRWADAVTNELRARGRQVAGARIEVTSTIPVGAGLSSSTALCVALTLALSSVPGPPIDRHELVLAAHAAEARATGVPTGLLDQLAIVHGVRDHALLIDCRDQSVDPLPLPATLAIVVVGSGMRRALASTPYAARRAESEADARELGLTSLRDASIEQVGDRRRARHVVTENARVRAFAEALRDQDFGVLGPLMAASHASLRDDYEVSTPELDLLADLLTEHGALGARLTGAGFGGSVVALAQRNHADDVASKTARAYRAATGIEPLAFVGRTVDGATETSGPAPSA
jgi:galactokinase